MTAANSLCSWIIFLSSFALIGFCKEKKRHSGGPRGFLFTNTSLLNAAEAGVGGACVCVEFSLWSCERLLLSRACGVMMHKNGSHSTIQNDDDIIEKALLLTNVSKPMIFLHFSLLFVQHRTHSFSCIFKYKLFYSKMHWKWGLNRLWELRIDAELRKKGGEKHFLNSDK